MGKRGTPNSTKTAPGRPFKPGQSGNPNGRPKLEVHVKELAKSHTVDAINTLVENLKNRDGRVSNGAAVALLDRAWGKPVQQLTGPDEGPLSFRWVNELGEDELVARAAEIIAARTKRITGGT